MATNRRKANIAHTDNDFYPTPAWGTHALLYYEGFYGTVDEVCCGEGDMSKVLEEYGYTVNSFDLVDRGYGDTQNFLKRVSRATNICTNPPFNIANEILEHALKLTDRKICLLLRTAFLESITRYNIFKYYPPTRVWTFSERLTMSKKGVDVKGGGTTSYSWFVWVMDTKQDYTELKWIRPGFKSGKPIKRFKWGKPYELLL